MISWMSPGLYATCMARGKWHSRRRCQIDSWSTFRHHSPKSWSNGEASCRSNPNYRQHARSPRHTYEPLHPVVPCVPAQSKPCRLNGRDRAMDHRTRPPRHRSSPIRWLGAGAWRPQHPRTLVALGRVPPEWLRDVRQRTTGTTMIANQKQLEVQGR